MDSSNAPVGPTFYTSLHDAEDNKYFFLYAGRILAHGTRGASVLLETAPDALLLVARIFDDNGRMPHTENYSAVVEVRTYIDVLTN